MPQDDKKRIKKAQDEMNKISNSSPSADYKSAKERLARLESFASSKPKTPSAIGALSSQSAAYIQSAKDAAKKIGRDTPLAATPD